MTTMTADNVYRRVVGKRLRVWRALHDKTQEDLADAAGVTRNFVSAIERGAQGLDAVRLRKVAAAMDTPLGDLLAEPTPDRRNVSEGPPPAGPQNRFERSG